VAEDKKAAGNDQPTAKEIRAAQASKDELAEAVDENAAIQTDGPVEDEDNRPSNYEHVPEVQGRQTKK
jgi:hypothetical protein